MQFLEIEDLKDKKVAAMSTGQLRKCIVGRALIHNPKAFVLDEPTLTTENLIKMLTRENLEHVEINSAAKTIEKENLKLITVSENLTDDHYRIVIRLSTN